MFKQVEPIERVHQTLADGRVQIRIGGCEGWRRAIYVAVVLGIGPECPLPEAASTGPCINFGRFPHRTANFIFAPTKMQQSRRWRARSYELLPDKRGQSFQNLNARRLRMTSNDLFAACLLARLAYFRYAYVVVKDSRGKMATRYWPLPRQPAS